MPSNHLILWHPVLLQPSVFPSIRVFSVESTLRVRWPKYWSFSFRIIPSKEIPGLISFRMDRLDLLAVQASAFLVAHPIHPSGRAPLPEPQSPHRRGLWQDNWDLGPEDCPLFRSYDPARDPSAPEPHLASSEKWGQEPSSCPVLWHVLGAAAVTLGCRCSRAIVHFLEKESNLGPTFRA